MAFDTFKDLKRGDRVKYENAVNGLQKIVSGEGAVFGFGHHAYCTSVWVKKDDGEVESILYEDVKKIQH